MQTLCEGTKKVFSCLMSTMNVGILNFSRASFVSIMKGHLFVFGMHLGFLKKHMSRGKAEVAKQNFLHQR